MGETRVVVHGSQASPLPHSTHGLIVYRKGHLVLSQEGGVRLPVRPQGRRRGDLDVYLAGLTSGALNRHVMTAATVTRVKLPHR